MHPEMTMPWLDSAAQSAGAPNIPMYVPAAVGLICGIVLLLAGGKVLRPITVLLGGAAGGAAGAMLLPGILPESFYGVPGDWIGMGLGAVVGMVAAGVLFRAAMATAGAVTFGAAGILAAGVWMGGLPAARPSFANVDKSAAETVVFASFPLQTQSSDETAAGDLARSVWGDAQTAWSSLPADARLRMIVAGLGGGLLGLMVGAIMPRKAAALLTSLFGAGVFLASLTWTAQIAEWPSGGLLEHGPMGWLAIWAVVAGAGLVFQLCGEAKPRPAQTAAA